MMTSDNEDMMAVTFSEFQEHILAIAQDFQHVETDQEAYELARHMVMDMVGFINQLEELYDEYDSDEWYDQTGLDA